MTCKASAGYDPDTNRYRCRVTGDECVFLRPDSKACAELYGEGPDAEDEGENIKWLSWSNGQEWGEITCPMLDNQSVMTYWGGGPCYDTWTAPFVEDSGIFCYRFDHDKGCWEEGLEYIGDYNGIDTCAFEV